MDDIIEDLEESLNPLRRPSKYDVPDSLVMLVDFLAIGNKYVTVARRPL